MVEEQCEHSRLTKIDKCCLRIIFVLLNLEQLYLVIQKLSKIQTFTTIF